MKIDIFSHFCPLNYKKALGTLKHADKIAYELQLIESCESLYNLDKRFRILDKHDCCQILTLVSPPIEEISDSKETVELAKLANDGIADALSKYPEYFLGGIATLPLNDPEASLREAERAINELKLRGILVHSATRGMPLDSPEFFPLYELMTAYNLPVFIHPWRTINSPDYRDETQSKYKIWSTFGWPYETSAAVTRLIFSGVFEKYPSLKIITHHAGGMIPFFSERIRSGFDLWENRTSFNPKKGLTRSSMEYYQDIYADTAIAGNTSALMCAYDFFGPDHLLFGTDMPMDSQMGFRLPRDIIDAIVAMAIPEGDKKKIFEDNAKLLLRLPIL